MTQIYLSKDSFAVLQTLRKQGFDPSELVSKLIMEFAQNPDRAEPTEKCYACSHRYFSADNLHAHIERVHGQKTMKNEARL